MLDEVLLPGDILALLESTNADYERVNQTAAGQADWTMVYADWQTFYKDTKGRWSWMLSQATADEIRRRQRILADWQATLKQRNIETGPTTRPSQPSLIGAPELDKLGDALKGAAKWAAVGLAGYFGLKLLSERKAS